MTLFYTAPPPPTTETAIAQIKQSYSTAWNGSVTLTKVFNLWYKTSTINSSVVDIVAYWLYNNTGYYTGLYTLDRGTGLYSYIYGQRTTGSSNATSTSTGMTTEYLSTLTLFYTA